MLCKITETEPTGMRYRSDYVYFTERVLLPPHFGPPKLLYFAAMVPLEVAIADVDNVGKRGT